MSLPKRYKITTVTLSVSPSFLSHPHFQLFLTFLDPIVALHSLMSAIWMKITMMQWLTTSSLINLSPKIEKKRTKGLISSKRLVLRFFCFCFFAKFFPQILEDKKPPPKMGEQCRALMSAYWIATRKAAPMASQYGLKTFEALVSLATGLMRVRRDYFEEFLPPKSPREAWNS